MAFSTGRESNPFVGIGVNYTRFFSIDEKRSLTGTRLQLNDSWGLAVHGGVDVALRDRWSVAADARWIGISSDAKINGTKVGAVDIDPFVIGAAIGYRF